MNCAFYPGDTHIRKDLDNEDVAMGSPDYDPNRNAHLKGRRRFNADLTDIQEASLLGFFLHGLKLQSMSVISTARHHILTETSRGCGRRGRRIIGDHHSRQLIQACPRCKLAGFRLAIFFVKHYPHLIRIIDTSEYPGSHSLFCYSPDSDLSAKLQKLIDDIAEESPKPLGETVSKMMASVAKIAGQVSAREVAASSSEESDGGERRLRCLRRL